MQAEIISIGDELTSGQVPDTNSQWLSLRLQELGIRVLVRTTVGDQLEAMVAAFEQACRRADVILTTGGLGPTPADLTRQALARLAGRSLVLDLAALEHIQKLLARRGRPMAECNRRQALFPQQSRMIPNPDGTAPGINLEVPRPGKPPVRLFALPGVPAEMKQMFVQTVSGELRKMGAGQRTIRHRRLNCFGAAESQIAAVLDDLIHRTEDPHVGITASQATIVLRISASGATEQACQQAIEPIAQLIRQRLGNLVFGEEDEELQDAVIRLLRQRNQTLATAEWGTGGLLAGWLGSVVGGQGYYLGGIAVCGQPPASRLFDLPADPMPADPEDLRPLVAAMASGCRERFAADLGLAVGPLPGDDPAAQQPQPVVLALAGPTGVSTKSVPSATHPALLKVLCAKNALDMLRLALLD
ncbi:MAG: CinA family nicotinamide mononucleotide deamidase-related protein [Thermoguttaceae bacterium]